MDSKAASGRPYSAEHPDPQDRLPGSVQPAYEAAIGAPGRESAARLLLLSLGVWAAIWAILRSLSSWLK
jgi:hypothetical protein